MDTAVRAVDAKAMVRDVTGIAVQAVRRFVWWAVRAEEPGPAGASGCGAKWRSAPTSIMGLTARAVGVGCAYMIMAVAVQMGASAAVAAPAAGLTIEPGHGQPTEWVNATLHATASQPLICLGAYVGTRLLWNARLRRYTGVTG